MPIRTQTRSGVSDANLIGNSERPGTGLHTPAAGVVQIVTGAGGTDPRLVIGEFDNSDRRQVFEIVVPVTGASGSAGVFVSKANPFGIDLVISEVLFDCKTLATATASLDIGVAANGTTGADTLLDGINIGSGGSAKVWDAKNSTDRGTNGLNGSIAWGLSQFVNVAEAAGNVDGLVGFLYLSVRKRA